MDPSLKPEQQAIQEVYVKPYSTFSGHGNYLHVSVGASRVVVGGSISIQAYIKSSLPNHRALVEHLTYIVSDPGDISVLKRTVLLMLFMLIILSLGGK